MNRNIRRKQPSDVIWAYKKFVDGLPEDERKDCLLLMHTAAVDQNGTDLSIVKEAICPDYDVRFSQARIDSTQLNYLYNLSDVTINIAGNEGFRTMQDMGRELILTGDLNFREFDRVLSGE